MEVVAEVDKTPMAVSADTMLKALEHGANALSMLVYGCSLSDTDGYVKALRNIGLAVHADRAANMSQLADHLELAYDFYLVDCDRAGDECPVVLEQLRQASEHTPLLLLSSDLPNYLTLAQEFGVRDLLDPKDEQRLQFVMQREFRDLLQRRDNAQLQQRLQEAEERCSTLIHSSRDAIAYVHEGMHVGANPVYLEMFGFSDEDELEGLPLMDLVAPEERARFKTMLRKISGNDISDSMEVGCVTGDGRTFRARMEFSPSTVDNEPCTQIVIRDQSQFQHLEDRIRELTIRDTDTGLYNRAFLLERLESQVVRLDEQSPQLHLLLLTVSNCAEICHNHGMELSESMLQVFSRHLSDLCEDLGTLARFGDHDFALLMPPEQDAQAAARQILEGLTQLRNEELPEVKPIFSIGIAASHDPLVISASDFVNRALRARHQAEREGENRYVVAERVQPLDAESGFDPDISLLLERAIPEDRLRLMYQPIVSLQGDARENYAVLLRLVNDQGQELKPVEFLETARKTGRMVEIDRWVIDHALAELTRQREQDRKANFIITLSREALQDEQLLLWLCDCLREHRAKGAWLTLQIHKRDIRADLQAARATIESLKKINCKVAVDAFDDGPSSDTLLRHLPIDIVKLKPELLEGIAGNSDRLEALKQINEGLQERGVKTIALGVEDANTLAALWNVGINFIQGNFVQPPSAHIEAVEQH
jgi:diguanylate cyclase (GGDEF)-like protein/PAS domain S-box-containing protein